jgi:two-component sensor histidine kinase
MKTLRKYKILVVDDSPDNLRTLVGQMERMALDIQSLQETSARNALEIARMETPDLIITDWEMPDMSGIEFIEALKNDKHTSKIPVIMCTGIMTSSINLQTALDAGAVDYVRKPIDPVEFQARVGSMLQLADSFQTIERHVKLVETQKEALLSEVHHRVQNNLQIIISLMNLQLIKIKDEGIAAALKENQGRVMSMSLVHQRMHQTANFDTIELKSYTTQLVKNVQERFPGIEAGIDLNISNEVFVDLDTAIPLALIINEIVLNFYKYCARDAERSFTINVTQADNQYKITYRDNGDGFPEGLTVENAETFGLELIEILTDQLDGEFKFYNDKGAVINLSLPMTNN